MITVICFCGASVQAEDKHVGSQVRCSACGNMVTLPIVRSVPPPQEGESALPAQRAATDRDAEEAWQRRGKPKATHTSGKAITALVFGILTFLLPVLATIPAVLFGALALGDIKRSRGGLRGGGLALAGIILGVAGNLVILPVLLAVQNVLEAAAKTQTANHLKQILLAMHVYHDVHKRLPPAVIYDQNGRPLYSWRVLILPYIEQGSLYKQFKLDEPWDSPNNKRLLQFRPPQYAHPGSANQDPTLTFFQVFDGPAGDGTGPRAIYVSNPPPKHVFHRPEPFFHRTFRFTDITDGRSITILVAEAAEGVPWTKPADLTFEPNQPLPKLGGHFRRDFLVGMASGSVRFLDSNRVTEETLRALVTANGGELLPIDWER